MRERESGCNSIVDGEEVESRTRLHPQQAATPPNWHFNARWGMTVLGVKVRNAEFSNFEVNRTTLFIISGRRLEILIKMCVCVSL